MIRYIEHNGIDRPKYDRCIRADRHNLVYGYSWYLDTVCEAWDALVLGDYRAVWPLPVKKKMGLKYFYRPFGVQQLGVFSAASLTEVEFRNFVETLLRHCSYADIYLNEGQLAATFNSQLKIRENRNYTLDLSASFREIYNSYHRKTRYCVQKASKNDLQLFEHDSPEALMRLFEENKGEHLQLSTDFYRVMKKAMYACMHKDMGKVWTLYGAGNRLLAGAFFIQNGPRHILFFTGLSPAGREHYAVYYLLNEYIIYHSSKPVLLDFEGSNDPGIARFYRRFGSRESYYLNLRINKLPFPLRWLKR